MQAPLLSDFEEHIETQGEEKCIFKRKGKETMQKIESLIHTSTYYISFSLFGYFDFVDIFPNRLILSNLLRDTTGEKCSKP